MSFKHESVSKGLKVVAGIGAALVADHVLLEGDGVAAAERVRAEIGEWTRDIATVAKLACFGFLERNMVENYLDRR